MLELEAVANAVKAITKSVVVLRGVLKQLVLALEVYEPKVRVLSLGSVQCLKDWVDLCGLSFLECNQGFQVGFHHHGSLVKRLCTDGSNDWHIDGWQLKAV